MPSQARSKDDKVIILLIIFLTLLIVVAVTYSVYLFIDLTHVSSAANVHITTNFVMAAKDAQGKLYSNEENGISNWLVYSDKNNGFEIKYPIEMQLQTQKNSERLLVLKKFNNSQINGSASLSMTINVAVKNVTDSYSIREELESRKVEWKNWKQTDFGGKPGIRTGEIKDRTGVIKDTIIWQFGGKMFSLEANYFNADSADNRELFDKIISEFQFT